VEICRRCKPEQILLPNVPLGPEWRDFLGSRYAIAWAGKDVVAFRGFYVNKEENYSVESGPGFARSTVAFAALWCGSVEPAATQVSWTRLSA